MTAPATTAPARASWTWAFAGAALGLALALLLFIPASWLGSRIDEATAGRLQLSDARGTLWTGSAQLLLTGGAGSKAELALPGRIDWHVRPRWNGLAVELNAPCCTMRPVAMRLKPGWRGVAVEVDDGQTQWPAALLAGLGTPWNTLQLDGDLTLLTQSLSVEWIEGRMALAGRAELRAQRLSSRLSTLRPMGSYRITLVGGATPTLQLETLEGSLQLSGSGQWIGSRLRFSGEATAAPDREDALSNLLNIIGRRSGARSIISIG
ncbi:type II secretion system protein N [Ramlibacter solisilvae]|uniref:Type II secretion system protein N n=1 Tax=Ramlibacter tataouinensis TaxID=94132 RepID=A0A127JU65_9BURK|nr:type II secretion system protein N [Ramlibacter tataouinensis]AMO23434.1 general secretion pathway protein GspN [Ramlibacter tataouinensis]